MKKIPLIISLALALIGCTKQGAVPETQVSPGIRDGNPGISRDIVSLTADDAVTVAQMFCSKEGKTKGGESKTVKNVVTISGKDGSANMYAVNFSNDEGFILVSATKKFFPILAEVEKGKFDDSIYQTGASVLLDEYNQSIDYYKAAPQEEVDKSFSAMWRAYEKKADVSAFLKTKSYEDDLMNLVPAAMHEWAEDGYSVYPLCNAQGCGIPQSVYNQWYNIASTEANQHYSFEENSFIIVKYEDQLITKGPLLTTKWNQGIPYNLSTTLYNGNHAPVGCVPLAVAQIMKFHQYPTTYSWNSMPDELIYSPWGTDMTLPNFLNSVGVACQVVHTFPSNDEISTASDIDKAKSALENSYNYLCSLYYYHNPSNVTSSIYSNRPVFMEGENSNEQRHAWVCDGYKYSSPTITYSLMIISVTDNPLYYYSPCQDYIEYLPAYSRYHMNWGLATVQNGWYSDSLGTAPVDLTTDRYELINIHPNN